MNKIAQLFQLKSTVNPEKLSMTIKGILTGLVLAASVVGIIPADAMKEVAPLTDLIVTVVQAGLALLAAVWTLWGAVRRIYNVYFKTQ